MVAFGILAFLASPTRAEYYTIGVDANGEYPGSVDLVGADVIDATSTVNYGLTTPVILYGVVVSSDAATNFATLRDTDTLNTTSNIKMTLYPNNSGGTSLASATSVLMLPAPVIFRNGISITLNAAPAGSSGTLSIGRWHFIVRRRNIGNARGQDVAFSDTAN